MGKVGNTSTKKFIFPIKGKLGHWDVFSLSVLTFPQMRNLDFSKLNDLPDDNYKFDENGRKFSNKVENNGKKVKLQ